MALSLQGRGLGKQILILMMIFIIISFARRRKTLSLPHTSGMLHGHVLGYHCSVAYLGNKLGMEALSSEILGALLCLVFLFFVLFLKFLLGPFRRFWGCSPLSLTFCISKVPWRFEIADVNCKCFFNKWYFQMKIN